MNSLRSFIFLFTSMAALEFTFLHVEKEKKSAWILAKKNKKTKKTRLGKKKESERGGERGEKRKRKAKRRASEHAGEERDKGNAPPFHFALSF